MKLARRSRTLGVALVAVLAVPLVSAGSAYAKDAKLASKEAAQKEQTVVLKMDDFELQPHTEGFKCQTYANPFGRDVQVTGWSFNSKSESAHHLLVFPEPNAVSGPVVDCTMRFDPIVLGSQNYRETVDFPSGIGTAVGATTGFVLRIHYANRSDEVETVDNPTLKVKVAPANKIESSTALYSVTTGNINVPAGTKGSATGTWTAPYDMELVWMASHMHDHGTRLTVSTGAKTVWVSKSADNPVTKVFKKPYLIPAGTVVTFRCDYTAPPEFDLRFGTSLITAEMCNMKGGYIRSDGQPAEPFQGGGGGPFGGGPPPGFVLPS